MSKWRCVPFARNAYTCKFKTATAAAAAAYGEWGPGALWQQRGPGNDDAAISESASKGVGSGSMRANNATATADGISIGFLRKKSGFLRTGIGFLRIKVGFLRNFGSSEHTRRFVTHTHTLFYNHSETSEPVSTSIGQPKNFLGFLRKILRFPKNYLRIT